MENVNDLGSSSTARPAATAAGCPCCGNRTSLDLRVQRREFEFKQSGFKAVLNSDCLNSNSSLFTAWLDAPRESNAAAGSRSRRAGEPVLASEPSFGRRMGGEGAYWSLEAGGRGPRSSESDLESDSESEKDCLVPLTPAPPLSCCIVTAASSPPPKRSGARASLGLGSRRAGDQVLVGCPLQQLPVQLRHTVLPRPHHTPNKPLQALEWLAG